MILRCSAGHEIDTESTDIWDRWHGRIDKRPFDRCGAEIGYNVMDGTTRCRRILHQVEGPSKHQNT